MDHEDIELKLDGKTALLTGTSPNIMGGIAEGLAEEGANVVCIDLQPEYANGCARAITGRGQRAIGIACDSNGSLTHRCGTPPPKVKRRRFLPRLRCHH